ncbi:CCA tRNA nucleotidyltransferase [Acetobacteraceae bacterium KSS8]|uniref:CCA tRNA nucleotidyltransferase n=1 Tax=Endosaccharibacter trunci TaxID=2812733 RepID=A0ABT1W2D9_9PROT|nr:CCA tRNA nucleotidyltransferase [Acetobacteraceae bacterium KSS8]
MIRTPEPSDGLIGGLDDAIRAALDRLWGVLPDARLVGGAVRDLLAGRPVSDIDLATPEPPERVLELLSASGIKVVATGIAHGTVTAVIARRPFEITTLREDTETDGRHARVAWTADWRADAARRDFTINSLFLDRNGAVHDFFGGAADLRDGVVRFVGEAGRRIEEDGLRILRFFRFQARYGRGAPDREATEAIASRLYCLDRLSAERVWSELSRLLGGAAPGKTLCLMQDTGVLPALLPGAHLDPALRLDRDGAPADALLRLAALAGGNGGWAGAVASRLKLSRDEARRLAALVETEPAEALGTDEDSLRRRLADAPAAIVLGRSWLSGESDTVRARIASIVPPVFPLAGRDAVQAGLKPGPEVGRLLAETRLWWWSGGCRADRPACLGRLLTLAGEAGLLPAA